MSVYVGVDPGADGGIVAIDKLGRPLRWLEMKVGRGNKRATRDRVEVYGWIVHCVADYDRVLPTVNITIERIDASGIHGAGKASFAKLYGSFCELRAFLIASTVNRHVDIVETPAREWLREFPIEPRKKGESTAHWKGRHRDCARALFKDGSISTSLCDSYLIAEYARRSHLNILRGGR